MYTQLIIWKMPSNNTIVIGTRNYEGNSFIGYTWNKKAYSKYCKAWKRSVKLPSNSWLSKKNSSNIDLEK